MHSVHDEPATGGPATLPGHLPEVFAAGQPRGRGKHSALTLPAGSQTDRRERPLRRRAARIARPARVRMRRRKPWVFARRRLFGWKVRLLTVGSPGLGRASGGHTKHAPTHGDPMRLRTRPAVTKSGFTLPGFRRSKSHSVTPRRDTPSTFGCLPCATSCGIARPLLACGLLVGEMGVGVPAAQLIVG